MKGIVFIRNSDVRFDTRLRKAIIAAKLTNNLNNLSFFGWIRDDQPAPEVSMMINDTEISAHYFKLPAKFGIGLANIFRLLLFNLWLLKMLIINRNSFSTIYVCDFDVSFPPLLIKFLFRKKIIYDIFDFYSHTHAMPNFIRYFVEKTEYFVCGVADVVVVCTDKRAKTIRDVCTVEPVIIYNTPNIINVNDTEFTKKLPGFVIVYVGTLASTGRLLREITEKLKDRCDIQFHVAGSGPLESYFLEMAQRHQNIVFYGQVSNDEAIKLQMRSDLIFATYDPSLEINKNSAPNKVYEAMALGKPIIVCRGTDADSEVFENNCGEAIEYSGEDFIAIVDKYIANSSLKMTHGANGYALYKKKYQWEMCEEKLKKVFNEHG